MAVIKIKKKKLPKFITVPNLEREVQDLIEKIKNTPELAELFRKVREG